MRLDEINAKALQDVPDSELLSLHRRCHQWYNIEERREEVREKHKLVVAEMNRRELNHHPTDELDSSLGKLRSEYGPEYFDDYRRLRASGITDLARVIYYLKEGERILDVGCGQGLLISILRNSGFDANGLDPSEEAVRRCQGAGLAVDQGRIEALPFEDGSYGAVVAVHVLEHTGDLRKAVDECLRVARRAVICVVPIGHREDQTHRHEWAKVGDLLAEFDAYAGGLIWELTRDNNAVLVFMKDPEFAGLHNPPDAVLVPDFISLVGSRIKRSGDKGDIDVVVRADVIDESTMIQVRNSFRKVDWDRIHFIANAQGPHDDFVSLADLVLRFRTIPEVNSVGKRSITPIARFVPPKPGPAYYMKLPGREEIKGFWDAWGKKHIGEGIDVELKFGGWRIVIEKSGAQGLIFFEGDQRNRWDQLQGIADDMKSVTEPVILDAEVCAVNSLGEPFPRIDLSFMNETRNKVPHNFTTPDGVKGTLVVHVFHLVHWDGKDYKTWEEQRTDLEKFFMKHKFTALRIVKKHVVKDQAAFVSAIDSVRREPGSEGAVCKILDSNYRSPIESGWAKIKNVAELRVRILKGPMMTAAGTKTYELGCWKAVGSKEIFSLGKSLATDKTFAVGANVVISAEEVIPELKNDEWGVGLIAPKIEGAADSCMDVKAILREGARSHTLQYLNKLRNRLRIFGKGYVWPDGDGFAIWKAEGKIDFKAGDRGTGVIQHHVMGIKTEEDARRLAASPLSAAHLHAMTRELKHEFAVHTDFRMLRSGDAEWRGGEFFTPGDSGQDSKLLGYKPGTKILCNFKVASSLEYRGQGKVVVGGKFWLGVGVGKPHVFEPGEAGAYPTSYAVIGRIGTLKWRAGTQDAHYKEFWIEWNSRFESIPDGRWTFSFAPLREGRQWLFQKPTEQRMDAEREKMRKVSYEVESALIRENRRGLEAHRRHKFIAAEWTYPNGHPRCLVCGAEPRVPRPGEEPDESGYGECDPVR